MYINLILAVFWLVLGIALFVLRWVKPDTTAVRVEVYGISVGWIAILLALYNVLRFVRVRAAQTAASQDDRLFKVRQPRSPAATEYDSTFDFTDQEKSKP